MSNSLTKAKEQLAKLFKSRTSNNTTNNDDDTNNNNEEIVVSKKYGAYSGYAQIIGTEENIPELTIKKSDSRTLYSITNNQSYNIRLLCSHSTLISESINKELISLIHPLEKTVLDYRYLIKDQIVSSKLNGWGPWICETCWQQNESNYNKDKNEKTRCIKCNKVFNQKEYFCYKSDWQIKWDKEKREKDMTDEQKNIERIKEQRAFENKLNLYNKMSDAMSKQQLITYHNNLFVKWKMRIQDLIDPLLSSRNKYWIPTEFQLIDNKVKFVSDINGLPRVLFPRLYELFENIFSAMIPSFNWIIGKHLNKIKLKKDTNLKVIINMQQYQLLAQQVYNGNYHREGFDEEKIIAGGVYYFDRSKWFDDNDMNNDIFEFISTANALGCNVQIKEYKSDVKIQNGNVVVFNNRYLSHKLGLLKNNDKDRVLTRSILCFFLVKPEKERLNEDVKENEVKNKEDDDDEKKEVMLSANDIMVNKNYKYVMIVNHWIRMCGAIMDVYNGYNDYEILVNIIVDYTIFSMAKERRIRDEMRLERLRPRYQDHGIKLKWVSIAN
eukprot:346488_1